MTMEEAKLALERAIEGRRALLEQACQRHDAIDRVLVALGRRR